MLLPNIPRAIELVCLSEVVRNKSRETRPSGSGERLLPQVHRYVGRGASNVTFHHESLPGAGFAPGPLGWCIGEASGFSCRENSFNLTLAARMTPHLATGTAGLP